MSEKHPSDEILQQYVWEPADLTPQLITHIDHCPVCQATIATYTAMSQELANQPKPAFDFDIAAAVLEKKTSKKPPLTTIGIAALVAIPLWLFRKSAYYVFTDMSVVFYGIVFAATAIVVSLFLLRVYKRYQQVFHLINE